MSTSRKENTSPVSRGGQSIQPTNVVLIPTPFGQGAIEGRKRPSPQSNASASSKSSKSSVETCGSLFERDTPSSSRLPESPITPPDTSPESFWGKGKGKDTEGVRAEQFMRKLGRRGKSKTEQETLVEDSICQNESSPSNRRPKKPIRPKISRKTETFHTRSDTKSLQIDITEFESNVKAQGGNTTQPIPKTLTGSCRGDRESEQGIFLRLSIPGAFYSQKYDIVSEISPLNDIARTASTSLNGDDSKQISYPEILHDSDDSEPAIPQKPVFSRYRQKHLERRSINTKIYNHLRKRKTTSKLGWVYIYESPQYAENFVKIGSTINPDRRAKEWAKCMLPIKPIKDTDRNAHAHFSFVEALASAELHNQRRQYHCKLCNQEHNEWYEIDAPTALKTIGRWRCWVKDQNPFDQHGILTGYWSWKVRNLPKIIDNVNWNDWTQPGPMDYYDYYLEEHYNHYLAVKKHLGRKDAQFWGSGVFIVSTLFWTIGLSGGMWGVIALLIL